MTMKIGLTQRILNYLEQCYHYYGSDYWVHGGEIERLAQQAGYKGSTAGRICRKMREEGKIKQKKNNRNHILYKYSPYYETRGSSND